MSWLHSIRFSLAIPLAMFYRSRRNLAQWFTLSMGSILLLFTAIIYYQKTNDSLESLDRLLYKKARVMAANVEYKPNEPSEKVKLKNVPLLGKNPPPLDTEVIYVRWYDEDGNLEQFLGAPPPEKLGPIAEFQTVWSREFSGILWLRQLTLPVQHQGTVIGYLQVAIPMTETQTSLREFLLLLAIVVPLTLGLIGLTGWWLGGLAMQPLRESYEQLHRFTANASHELRAPLAAILSNAQVGMLARGDDGAKQRQRLEKIATLTKSMSTLINDLLFLARHGGTIAPASLQWVNFSALLEEVAQNLDPLAQERQLTLRWNLAENIQLRCEPNLLRQVVMNLLNNACHYTPAQGSITLTLETHGRLAIARVEDTGIGISEDHLPHIFERFYRVDDHRSKETGGTGLGLAIAQQIVQAHGGIILVKSQVGKGTVFQIELPLD